MIDIVMPWLNQALIGLACFAAMLFLVMTAATWVLLRRMGQRGWTSLIPVYSTWKVANSANENQIWSFSLVLLTIFEVVFAVISLTNGINISTVGGAAGVGLGFFNLALLAMTAMTAYHLSKAFGHGIPYAVGLLFLPFVFYWLIGFGTEEYLGPQ